MGEAKRRKELGLPPKVKKKEDKQDFGAVFRRFRRNQILPVLIGAAFVTFLIFDLVRYYNSSS